MLIKSEVFPQKGMILLNESKQNLRTGSWFPITPLLRFSLKVPKTIFPWRYELVPSRKHWDVPDQVLHEDTKPQALHLHPGRFPKQVDINFSPESYIALATFLVHAWTHQSKLEHIENMPNQRVLGNMFASHSVKDYNVFSCLVFLAWRRTAVYKWHELFCCNSS